MTADWRDDRIGAAHRGENPMVMVDHLTDLDWQPRREFLFDLSLIGEAVQLTCRGRGLRRVNYEVLGNAMSWLHGHVHPRYDWEPPEHRGRPVWSYPDAERTAAEHAYSDDRHRELRSAIASELERLMAAAY